MSKVVNFGCRLNNFEGKKIALKEEENKTLQSNFWDDSSNAQIVLKKS